MDLQQRQLDINQESINFNKKMQIANTVINATQAAVSLTNAAVQLGSTIYKNQALKAHNNTQDLQNRRTAAIENGIVNGQSPYREDGQFGFDHFKGMDGVTVAELDEQIKNEAAKSFRLGISQRYWLSELESGYQRQELGALLKIQEREQAYFKQNMDEDFNNFNQSLWRENENFLTRTEQTNEDENAITTRTLTLEEAVRERLQPYKDSMSAAGFELEVKKRTEDAKHFVIQNETTRLAGEEGIAKAEDYIKTRLNAGEIDQVQSDALLANARKTSNNVEDVAVTRALSAYDEVEANPNRSRGDAYRAAMQAAGNHPDGRAAAENRITARHEERLNNDFFKKDYNRMSLSQLETERRNLLQRRGDYQGSMPLHARHLEYLDREIDQKQPRSSGSGSSAKSDAENVMANIYVQFHSNEISGQSAIRAINQIRELSPEKAAGYLADIIGRDGNKLNPAARVEYQNLEAILTANKPDNRASAQIKEQYELNSRRAREAIFQAYYDGVRGEDLTNLVQGFRTEIASNILKTVWNRGDLGNAGLLSGVGRAVSADEAATAIAFHGNQGNLDLRFSERTTDAMRPDRNSTNTVGGESADRILNQAAEHNRTWVNNELRNKGLQLTQADIVRDGRGDRDGRIQYRGNDGKTYRVNATAENGNRFLEVLENNRWVRVNINSLPNLSVRSNTGTGTGTTTTRNQRPAL